MFSSLSSIYNWIFKTFIDFLFVFLISNSLLSTYVKTRSLPAKKSFFFKKERKVKELCPNLYLYLLALCGRVGGEAGNITHNMSKELPVNIRGESHVWSQNFEYGLQKLREVTFDEYFCIVVT